MQGSFALFAKALAATALVTVIAGCEPPRVKSIESTVSATTSNPARDFKKEPLDPYSWGGIAAATGGREPRTTYGALAPGGHDGVDEVYLPISPNPSKMDRDSTNVYMLPDPRKQNKVEQFVGSRYLDNEGKDLVKTAEVINHHPPRTGLAKRAASGSGESQEPGH
jgi:hypothetical protein